MALWGEKLTVDTKIPFDLQFVIWIGIPIFVRPPPRTSVGIFYYVVSHGFKVRHCDLSCTERKKRNTESVQPSSKQLHLITGWGSFQSLSSRYRFITSYSQTQSNTIYSLMGKDYAEDMHCWGASICYWCTLRQIRFHKNVKGSYQSYTLQLSKILRGVEFLFEIF